MENQMKVPHEFTLPCGVKAGVYRLKGIHQRWLTEKNDLTFKQKLYTMATTSTDIIMPMGFLANFNSIKS